MRVRSLALVALCSSLGSCAAAPRPCDCPASPPSPPLAAIPVCQPSPVASGTPEPGGSESAIPLPEPTAKPPEPPALVGAVKPATPAKPGVLGYAELWRARPTGWAAASAITPSGDLATSAGDVLTINARHDGTKLESAAVCEAVGPRAMTVLQGKLYVACHEQVVEVTMPGLATRVVVSDVLKGTSTLFREAAFGGDKLVYTHNDGTMEIYSTKTWTKLSSTKLPKDTFAQDAVVSQDGKRMAVSNGDAKTVHLFIDGREQILKELRQVIAFSPDGARAFGSPPGYFKAADVALTGGAMRELMDVGSWLTAAVYFGQNLLAVAGSDGISVKNLDTGALQELIHMTAETLAVRPDGNLICGADRGQTIACFGRGVIAPSTYPKARP
jgi:hypothetical protein